MTTLFEQAIETAMGESIENLRQIPIDERRARMENASGRTLFFRTRFPFIGRGNVMRDHVVHNDKVESDFLRAVHGKQET